MERFTPYLATQFLSFVFLSCHIPQLRALHEMTETQNSVLYRPSWRYLPSTYYVDRINCNFLSC